MTHRNQLRKESGWVIALGILMIILGIIAIASPFFTTLAAEMLLGWLFVLGSVVQIFYAFQQDGDGGSFWLKLLLGILYLVVGILLLANPLVGALSLTLLVGIFFFIDGVFRVFLAFRLKPQPRWGWILFNGILMIILGILIWSQWPFNAFWILGLLVGIGLLVNGIATVVYGTATRDLGPQ